MFFEPILVITRPKKNGLGTHFGVQFSHYEVYDYTIDEGFRAITREKFADGEPITVAREIAWHMRSAVRARLEELRRNPKKYDLLAWNCESFAAWLTEGIARSRQIAAVLLFAGIAVAVAFAARS